MQATALRDDAYQFMRLGAAIDRIDSTARLLDVKYHILLPSVEDVGSPYDHYQWQSLLQAAAGQRAYMVVTKSDISARGVAEFLLLQRHFPRAIFYNLLRVQDAVEALAAYYGRQAECQAQVRDYVADFNQTSIDHIFAYGLHEFLTDIIARNYAVADGLARSYGFAPNISEGGIDAGGGQ